MDSPENLFFPIKSGGYSFALGNTSQPAVPVSQGNNHEAKEGREQDDDLLTSLISDQNLTYNEGLAVSKYNELVEMPPHEFEKYLGEAALESKTEILSNQANRDHEKQPEPKEGDSSDMDESEKEKNEFKHNFEQYIGLIDFKEYDTYSRQAVSGWSQEVLKMCQFPKTSASSFTWLMRKRMEVLKRLHIALLRNRDRENEQKQALLAPSLPSEDEEPELATVPVVLRLGILSLFPMIESLSGIPQVNTNKLCCQILDILNTTLIGLKPLTLAKEPADCLDAFRNFLYSLVKKSEFQIDTPEKVKSITALVGLAMNRGSAQDSLLVAESLLAIHQKMKTAPKLDIEVYLTQIQNHQKDQDISSLFLRGLIDTFQINQSSLGSKSEARPTEAIASDGDYVYIHFLSDGLKKIGTGRNGTVVGHIYRQNANFYKGEDTKSLVWAANKLYFWTQKARAASGGAAPKQSKPKDSTDESAPFEISVVSPTSLEEDRVVKYTPKTPFLRSARSVHLLSDGTHLYLFGRQKPAESAVGARTSQTTHPRGDHASGYSTSSSSSSSSSHEDEPKATYVVEVIAIAPQSGDLSFVRTVQLAAPTLPPADLALQPHHFDKAVAYATTAQLVVLIPSDNSSAVLGKARVFSLNDGRHITDHKIKNEPHKIAACYNNASNAMFTYNSNTVSVWKNLGPASGEGPVAHAAEFNPTQPLGASIFILSNMCRLARHHPLWDENYTFQFSESHSEDSLFDQNLFVIDPSLEVCTLLCSIVSTAMSNALQLKDDIRALVTLSCVKLLKLNLYEYSRSAVKTVEAKKEVIQTTQQLLDKFIEEPPMGLKKVQAEACRAYALGLATFYPSSNEQRALIVSMLKEGPKLGAGRRQLLENMLQQLADCSDGAFNLLVDEPATPTNAATLTMSNNNNNSAAQSQQVVPDNKSKLEARTRVLENSRSLATGLFEYVLAEDLARVKQATTSDKSVSSSSPSTAHVPCGPRLSPALRLLVATQRELVSNPRVQVGLVSYAQQALAASEQLIEVAREALSGTSGNAVGATLQAELQSTLLGALVSPLATSLMTRTLVSSAEFVGAVLPAVTRVLRGLDKLNQSLPAVLEADRSYLQRLSDRHDAKHVVESKHPYPQAQNQIKQTVQIPGAQYLALKFDSRCRTSNTASDLLQVFKSSLLIETAVNARDGKSLVFSGQNWPHQTQIVKGDTITFLFSANSRADSRDKHRWGFRCTVTEFVPPDNYQPLIPHWLLDLENVLALLAGKACAALIEGRSLSDVEKRMRPWLEHRLFSGGLEDTAETDPSAAAPPKDDPESTSAATTTSSFLNDFVEDRGDAKVLVAWMNKQKGVRQVSPKMRQPLEKMERCIEAAMIKHLGLADDARQLVELIKRDRHNSMEASSLNKEAFVFISHEVAAIYRGLSQLAQAQNEWDISLDERPNQQNFLADSNKDRVRQFCQLHNIPTDGKDDEFIHKALWEEYQRQTKAIDENTSNNNSSDPKPQMSPAERVCAPVIERAQLLLTLRAATASVQMPSLESPNPFADSSTKSSTASSSSSAMGRSSSYYPARETEVATSVKVTRIEQKTDEFNRRVTELRKWMQAFKSWKAWQGGLSSDSAMTMPQPPSNPASAIASFVQNRALGVARLPALLRTQAQRATARIEGLKQFRSLLKLVSFNSARQQILGALGAPLATGGHILDYVAAAGPTLKRSVASQCNGLLEDVFAVMQDAEMDPSSRLLALTLCTVAFKESDVDILAKTRIFRVLQQVIQEAKIKIAQVSNELRAPAAAVPAVFTPLASRQQQRAVLTESAQRNREQKSQEDEVRLKRYALLRQSAWNAFRILATRVMSWDHTPFTTGQVVEREALKELQTEVFDLMCTDLKRLSKTDPVNRDADGDQTTELLSLLFLLSRSSKAKHAVKALSKDDNVENFFAILKSPAQPRAKRLTVSLLQSLLPVQKDASISFVEFLFSDIGALLNQKQIQEKARDLNLKQSADLRSSTDALAIPSQGSAAAKDEPVNLIGSTGNKNVNNNNSGMSASTSKGVLDDDDEDEDEEDEELEAEPQYSAYLLSWALGPARLVEVCQNCLGMDFFGGNPQDRPAIESKVQKKIEEMNEEGKVSLKVSSLANCNLLAQALSAVGGSVSIQQVDTKQQAAHTNPNLAKLRSMANPHFWMSGGAAAALAAQFVELVRVLLAAPGSKKKSSKAKAKKSDKSEKPAPSDNKNNNKDEEEDDAQNNPWVGPILALLRTALLGLPAVLRGTAPTATTNLALAALAVLGGPLGGVHIGSRVQTAGAPAHGELRKLGTVVALSGTTTCHVVFDTDPAQTVRTVALRSVEPVETVGVAADRVARILSGEGESSTSAPTLRAIAEALAVTREGTSLSPVQFHDVRCRIVRALAQLARGAHAAQTLVAHGRGLLQALSDTAAGPNGGGDPGVPEARLRQQLALLVRARWDELTKPALLDSRLLVKVGDIIKHHPHTKDAELWPTGLHIDRSQYFVLSSERRRIEYVAPEPNPFARNRNRAPPVPTEVMVPANAPLPSAPEFYFEVHIQQTDAAQGSLLSIGLVPEGARNWGNGSLRYQANAKKTSFIGGSRRQSDYGTRFGKGNVLGCGYNKEEKVIYFTKDGVDQGPAFTGVTLGKMLPAIGLSRGVIAMVNFGQEPFKFKLHIEGESAEEKKQRKLEEEEKRKKALQEEKERKKKEREEERKSHALIAQPLLNMGLTLSKAIYALEQNNWDPNQAANWVFENPLDDFDEEEEEDEEKEGKKDETDPQGKESEGKEGAADAGPEAKKEEEEIETGPANMEEKYNSATSQTVFLRDNYTYTEELPTTSSKISQEWEDHVIPVIRKFMEKDNFAPLEIEEYCTMIRTQLEAGNEKQAKEIIGQIVGETGAHIAFPSASASSKTAAPALKIEQIRTGDWLQVSKAAAPDSKFWVSPMDKTLGQAGLVKMVDHQTNLVLLEFYSPEKATLSQWWFSLKALEMPAHPPEFITTPTQLSDLDSQLLTTFEQLGKNSVRALFLNLFTHFPLSMNPPTGLEMRRIIQYLAREPIPTALLPIEESPSKFLPVFENQLCELFSNPSNNPSQVTSVLVQQMANFLGGAAKLEANSETTFTSGKNPAVDVIQVSGARSLILTFERAGTSLPTNAQASVTFSLDEAGSHVVKVLTDKSKFFPVLVPANTVYAKINSNPQHRSNCKWKILATPVHPSFYMTFWLAEFLMKNCQKYVIPPDFVLPLYNALLDYVYATKAPSALKEATFHLLAQLLQLTTDKPPKWDRLLPLRQELVQLHTAEKQKGGLYSSYLKSLAELFVVVSELDVESLIGELPDPNADKAAPQVAREKPSMASALAKSLNPPASEISDQKKEEGSSKKEEGSSKKEEGSSKKEEGSSKKEEGSSKKEESASAKEGSNQQESAKRGESEPKSPEPTSHNSSHLFGGFGLNYSPFGSESIGEFGFSFGNSPFKEPEPEAHSEDEDEELKRAMELSLKKDDEEVLPAPELLQTPTKADPALKQSGSSASKEKEGKEPQDKKAPEAAKEKEKLTQIDWLNGLCQFKARVKSMSNPDATNTHFASFVSDAWAESKKEVIQDRVLLVDNLPLLFDPAKKEELENTLKRLASDVALLSGLFMPEDQESKQTKGYAFLEVTSGEMVEAVVKKLHRYKLKLGTLASIGTQSVSEESVRSSLRASTSLPRGTIKVYKFADLDLKEQGPKVLEYLQSKLVTSAEELTPEFNNVLEEIFNDAGGKANSGVLFAKDLNALQQISNDTQLSPEQLEFLFKTYDTQTVNSEKGLTVVGFKHLYLKQSVTSPLDTWGEIEKLGYDTNLRKKFFPRLQDALASQVAINFTQTVALSEFIESHYSECELSTPMKLTTDHLREIGSAFPQLGSIPLVALRLRLVMLQMLNKQMKQYIPYIDMQQEYNGSFAQLISHSRDIFFHSSKFEFVHEVLDKVAVTVPQPVANIDRIRLQTKKDKEGEIASNSMFHIVWQQLQSTPAALFRQKKPLGAEPHFSIKIVFKNENVQGDGGPYRQFFTDVSRELKEVLPLFIRCPNAAAGLGDNRDKYVIAPSCDSEANISQFEFLGRLMGICINTGVRLTLDLPPLFWKPLVGLKTKSQDLKEIDGSLYNTNLDYFLNHSKEQLEAHSFYNKTFTATLSDGVTVPLIEGGENINVDWDNRKEYVKLVEMMRLNEAWAQLSAIKRGLLEFVPPALTKLLTPHDIEWKVCGRPFIDINLLRRHTTYSGVSADAPHIGFLWQTLNEFSQSERRGFLRFVWAQERLPLNDEEFERTKTRMTIKPYGGASDPNSVFPKTDTCFFNVMIPEYTSKAVLKEKLLFAIATDSHSMNADAPEEDELATVNRGGNRRNVFEYSSDSESEPEY